MRILSRVCAKFEHPTDRNTEFSVRPHDRLVIMTAPDWLNEVLLFKWLVDDGSIDVVDGGNKITLENDPNFGISPEGKKIAITQAAEAQLDKAEQAVQEKPKRTRRKTEKAETEV